MRLNKKGMTSIELLVSFIVVSTIVVSMFNLIMNYRNKEQIEEINNEVISYSNNLQKVIQDDLIKGHLINVTNVSVDGYSATFTFDTPNSYTTTLVIDPDNYVISYGKSGDVIDYEIPNISDLQLSPKSNIAFISLDNNYLQINIILTHPNFANGTYSFMINCPVNYVH